MRRTAITLSLLATFATADTFQAANARASGGGVTSARAALVQTIPSVKLDSVTLKDALAFVQDLSAANVHVNWRALEAAGVTKDALIDLNLRGVSLRKALNLILSEAAGGNATLTYTVDDNVIEITTQQIADQTMVTRVYPVADLLMDIPDFVGPTFDLTSQQNGGNGANGGGNGGNSGGGSGASLFSNSNTQSEDKTPTRAERGQQLVDLITSIVRPDIWQANGGPARIRFFNDNLIVTAPASVQGDLDAPE